MIPDDIEYELKSKPMIEAQQMELVDALVYHISKTHSGEENRLANIIHILIESKTAQHEFNQLRSKWFDLWPDLNYSQLGLELVKYI